MSNSDLELENNEVEKTQEHKLFVGNVPFKCSHDEFNEIFENEKGYVKSELIYRPKSTLTRGFGFVEFKTEEELVSVLDKQFNLNSRELRVTKYSSENKPKYDERSSYKLFVRNLGDTSLEDFENFFTGYGNVSKCYLLPNRETGETRGLGVVEFNDKECFKKVLQEKTMELNNNLVSVYPFKNKQQYKNNKRVNTSNKSVYRNGYNDGRMAGYSEGYQVGYNCGYEDKENDLPKNSKKNYLNMPHIKNVIFS